MADRIGPVLSPALRDKHRVGRPADLRRIPLLHADTRPRAWSHWLRITGTEGLDATKGPRFEHTYFLLEAAAAGLGAAVGSHPLLEQDLGSGRLVAPFGFLPGGRSYALLRARRAPKAAKVAAFAEWIVARPSDPPPRRWRGWQEGRRGPVRRSPAACAGRDGRYGAAVYLLTIPGLVQVFMFSQ